MAERQVELKRCTCKNTYQDFKYGAHMRVHNPTLKPPGWRCTVCNDHKPDFK